MDPVTKINRQGPAIRCHAVLSCPRNGGRPDDVFALSDLEDPTFVDRGSRRWNEEGCKQAVRDKIAMKCDVKIEPEIICLDVGGPAGGPGPDVAGAVGGTIVTVGAAASGDFHLNGIGGSPSTPSEGGGGI